MPTVDLALTLLAVVGTVTVVAALARRLGISPPLALIVTGVAGSYLPFIPEPRLSAEVVLVGLLPPLLYAAAIRTSLVDFRDEPGCDRGAVGGPRALHRAGRGRARLVAAADPLHGGASPSGRWSRPPTPSPPRPWPGGSACPGSW